MIGALISGLLLGGILYFGFFALIALLAILSALPWGLILTISLIILAAIMSVMVVYKIVAYFASRLAARNFIDRINRTIEKKPHPLSKKGKIAMGLGWTMFIILAATFWLKEHHPSTALDNWAFSYLLFIYIPSVLILCFYAIKNWKTLRKTD